MTPKPFLLAVLMIILLPILTFSQQFSVNKALNSSDEAFFMKELTRISPQLQAIATNPNLQHITAEEAADMLIKKIKALNDPELNKLIDDAEDDAGETSIGVVLHILMNGLSNTEDATPAPEYKSKVGAGIGVYAMWKLANFLLGPELIFIMRSFGVEYAGNSVTTKFSQLALAINALYAIRLTTLSIVLGVSPTVLYSLSGKYVYDNDDKEDVEFGGEDGANRITTQLGLNAGILLRNMMMIRFIYSIGLSKIYKDGDEKMYMMALAFSIPFSVFSGGKK